MTEKNLDQLRETSKKIRRKIIEVSCKTKTPHLGTCLSSVDILVAIYGGILRIDPKNPSDPSRDRFILSKGHGAPALYPVLADAGFFSEDLLLSCNTNGSLLGEHPIPNSLPGIEAATGSLGHGLSIGAGLALGSKISKDGFRVFVVLGDGECNEGSVWEAAMFASSAKLNNLIAIVDFNKWQGTGRSQEIMHIDPFVEKWKSFGWNAVEIDGHSMEEVKKTLLNACESRDLPTAIIAHTVKGKGASFMEDDNNWHYRIPTEKEVAMAWEELR